MRGFAGHKSSNSAVVSIAGIVTFEYANADLDLWIAIVLNRVASRYSISFHPTEGGPGLN